MIPMLIVSAVAGVGLLRLYRLAFPAAPPLADQAARWERARARAGRRARSGHRPRGPDLVEAGRGVVRRESANAPTRRHADLRA